MVYWQLFFLTLMVGMIICSNQRCVVSQDVRYGIQIKLFKVLRANMFNQIEKTNSICNIGDNVYRGYVSYIHMVRWDSFINNISFWINEVKKIQDKKKRRIRYSH